MTARNGLTSMDLFEDMTELSKALRRKLSQTALISLPRVHSTQLSIDGTQKYLLELQDGQKIESVFIPEDHRHTFCISTQVGCPMECQVCLTALLGFARNLTVGEIVGQVLFILKDREEKDSEFSPHAPSKPTNIVLMGMGEPLLNFDGWISPKDFATGQSPCCPQFGNLPFRHDGRGS